MPERLDDRSPPSASLLSTSLPPVSRSARDARRAVWAVLRDRLPSEALDTVLLLTTELVSNAAVYAPHQLDLRIVARDDMVQVEVADSNPTVPTPAEPGPDAESGRGLRLVAALADAWGAEPTPPVGKVMWFALRT